MEHTHHTKGVTAMRKSTIALLAVLLGCVLLLTACGAKANSIGEYAQLADYDLYDRFDYEESYTEDVAYEPGDGVVYNRYSSGEVEATAPAEYTAPPAVDTPAPSEKPSTAGRKLIKDISASVETKQFDRYMEAIEAKTIALGGHIESLDTSDAGYYGYRDTRSANLTIRIPSDKLTALKGALGEFGKVTRLNESVRDVTMKYTDVQAEITALKVERDALLNMMEATGKLADLLVLQERLTGVRHQLNRLESEIRLMDDQVSLSTVTLRVIEVERLAP